MELTMRFDTEVEAILCEVSREPGSVLMRAPRMELLSGSLLRETSASAAARASADFLRAKQRLFSVHREEAAYLVRLAYYSRVDDQRDSYTRGLFETDPREARGVVRCSHLSRALWEQLEAMEHDREAHRYS